MRKALKNIRRRGTTLIYATIGTATLAGFVSFAVDWGRVQVAKAQLQTAADAAARYGASGLQNELFGASAAADNAAAIVNQNYADGRTISFNKAQDVVIGVWNTSTHKFTANSDLSVANAVKVTLQCSSARGTAIQLPFLTFLGRKTADVSASSIAMIEYTATGGAGNGSYEYYIPATSNLWLAGMPSGTIANDPNPHDNPDYAGTAYTDDGTHKTSLADYTAKKSSPIKAGGIPVTPGSTLTFDGVNGGANNFSSDTYYDGDGNQGWITDNLLGEENGVANLYAPINGVVGMFLTNSKPTSGSTPASLDFTTTASRDYDELKPALKQPFFIGDGRKSTGEVQRIVVPAGATRFYIGTMDGWEWNNNIGGFNVTAHVTGKIVSVRER